MRALVIGSEGQDGWYLSRQLEAAGVTVDRLSRTGLLRGGVREPVSIALDQRPAIRQLIGDGEYRQIYYLAAFHHSSQHRVAADSDLVRLSFAAHVDGLVNVLDAMVAARSSAAFVYAASSHVFGIVSTGPQTELTPIAPVCAYGISKAAGAALCRLYRQEHRLRASVALLYNHESPRRPPSFLSRKVARVVAAIVRGSDERLRLGALGAQVDWGYAPEYTEAMQRIAALDAADDFLIASGRPTAVRDFVAAAFDHVGLDWQAHVTLDLAIVQKVERGSLFGDAGKLDRRTGWRATTTAEALAALMVDAELREPRESGHAPTSM
jgi:GDPmannose 4,6-dehydratase